MDEKGLMIGKIKKMKRVFNRQAYSEGKLLGAVEDGNREWITMIATICADGSWHRPMLIYSAAGEDVQDNWIASVDWRVHGVVFTASQSGWTNDSLGFEWLKYFDRRSREKLDSSNDYRLLILDGHGSHMTVRSFEYCIKHRILLAVFPPHSTHRLQPLDITMFRPFAMNYSKHLNNWFVDRMGACRVSKSDFFDIFWPSYTETFTEKNILSAFKRAGINPRGPAEILSKVKSTQHDSRPGSARSTQSTVSIHAFREVRKQLKHVTSGLDDRSAAMVGEFLQKYQFELAIVEHQRDSWKRAFETQKSKQKPSQPLANKQFKEEYGDTHLWDEEKMALRNALIQAAANAKAEKALAAQHKKEAKKQEKERQDALKAQKKALTLDNQLQARIQRDVRASEAAEGKNASKSLAVRLKKAQPAKESPKDLVSVGHDPPEAVEAVVVEDNGGPSDSGRQRSTRQRRLPQYLDSYEISYI